VLQSLQLSESTSVAKAAPFVGRFYGSEQTPWSEIIYPVYSSNQRNPFSTKIS
jgi:hypothetical protein